VRKLFLSILAASAALGAAAPAAAAPPAKAYHRDSQANTLELRLRSIEIQIDIMSDRGMMSREEARALRQQSRRLEQRLNGMSRREAADVEIAVDRLQALLRNAAEGARLGDYASNRRALGRFDDGDRYRRDEDYYGRDSYERADPRGDPFAIWEERDRRDQGMSVSPH
jgi:hypothetical protein